MAPLDDLRKQADDYATGNGKGILAHKVSGVADLPKVAAPNLKRTITTHKKKVYCATWDIDSLHICTAGQEGNVCYTDASLNVIKRKPIKCPFVMQCAVYDGRLIACGGMQNIVELHDISEETPKCLKQFEGHEGYISQLHFLEKGTKLMSGSGDGFVKLWDTQGKKLIQTFEGHEQDVSGVAMCNGDSKVFATSSTDKTLRVWDMRQQYAVRKFTCKYGANCCAMMPNSTGVVAGCDSASWEYWDIGSSSQVARGKVKSGRCESVAISSSGRFCYLGWDNNMLVTADTYVVDNQKRIEQEKDRHTQSVCSLSVAPDGSALLSGSFDTTAKVWGA